MLPDLVVNRPSESPKVHEPSDVSKILGELDVPELNFDRINTEAPTTSDAAATCEHPEAPYLTDAVVVTDTATNRGRRGCRTGIATAWDGYELRFNRR